MAKSALIEELEKQFNENPRRVFARLANEYRKAGELELAIEICRTHIPQQPSYISGYIVLGQALFESQQHEEAKSTFETALGLDPENLIALRQLGDIARVQGDADTARAWYQRLLEVDPQNEEAAAQLEALEPSPPASTPQPSGGSPFDEFGWREIHPSDPPAVASEPAHDGAPEARATSDQMPAWMNPEPPALSRESDAVADREPIDVDKTPVVGVPAVSAESPDFPEQRPSATESVDLGGADLPELDIREIAAEPASAAPFDEPPSAMPALDVAEPGEEARESREPEAAPQEIPVSFITETMAELYLQQGFSGEALGIYRQLLVQRPEDQELLRKIDAIEARSARDEVAPLEADGETIRDFFTRIARMRAPAGTEATSVAEPPAAEPPDEWVEPAVASAAAPEVEVRGAEIPETRFPEPDVPEGASPSPAAEVVDDTGTLAALEALDREELEASAPRPAAAPSPDDLFAHAPVAQSDEEAARALSSAFDEFLTESGTVSGQPAREATNELSLDDVFRDSSTPAPQSRANGGAVSFDDFFSRAQEGTRGGDGQSGGDRGESKPSDLETFHAWLEGLKK